MKITQETIAHLEELARIELSREERKLLAEQLGRIVEYCEQLQSLDTDDVTPTTAVVHENENELRDDVVKPGLDRDIILSQAPDAKDGYFRVPKIIER